MILSRTRPAFAPGRACRGTLPGDATLATAGMAVAATACAAWLGTVGVLTPAVGQRVAALAPGLLALARADPSRRGAAVGLCFTYCDAGVRLGDPLVGLAARVASLLARGRHSTRSVDRRRRRIPSGGCPEGLRRGEAHVVPGVIFRCLRAVAKKEPGHTATFPSVFRRPVQI